MTDELDFRNRAGSDYRGQLFEALSEADPGDTIEIIADEDIDSHLVRYQIENDRAVTWDYADPDAEPRELQVTLGESLDDSLGTIDVRDLKPQRRHEALLGIFDELNAGEGFVLVNDHDPKPLYHELRSMHGDVVDWEYASRGGGEWRVEVVKTGRSEAPDEDIVTRYDVRDIPEPDRHPTIHHRYGMLPDGGTMEVIAPHEPEPLHQEFRSQYDDAFEWEVVESEPGRCRVQITKTPATDEKETENSDAGDSKAEQAPLARDEIDVSAELDVRDRPPAERHERIYDAYDGLDLGEGFVLVNDHDPKPLYHQFEAEAGPEFHWEYLEKSPGAFRVLVGKTETGTDTETIEDTNSST